MEEKSKKINLDQLFDSAEIFDASDEVLDDALKELVSSQIPKEHEHSQEIIRGLVINTIKNQRHVDRIETRSLILTLIIILLTIISIFRQILPIEFLQ